MSLTHLMSICLLMLWPQEMCVVCVPNQMNIKSSYFKTVLSFG